MDPWIAFLGIIGVRTATRVAVECIQRRLWRDDRHDHGVWELLLASVAGGFALGALFDAILGWHLSFFGYRLESTAFFVANGILSYGLAVATALRLSPRPMRKDQAVRGRSLAILIFLCSLLMLSPIMLSGSLPMLFAVGAAVVLAGESIELICFNTFGPFLESASGRFDRILRTWLMAAGVGLSYELGNMVFPVWHWSLGEHMSHFAVEFMIVVFGYVVLLHAVRVAGLLALALVRGSFWSSYSSLNSR